MDNINLAKLRPSKFDTSLLLPFTCAFAPLAAIFLSFGRWYGDYTPYGDDFSILSGSLSNPKEWLVRGFSNYFMPFPEWSVPYTDFMRPGVSAITRIEHALFGNSFFLYFLTFFMAHGLLIGIIIWMARETGVSFRWLCLLACLLAIEPAFVDLGLLELAFQFDVWCGVFAIFGFYCVVKERYFFAFAFLLLTVFTKEAGLYAPIAAALTVLYANGRKALAFFMLTPLLIWAIARKWFFIGSGIKGVYAIGDGSASALVGGALRGLFCWPAGIFKLDRKGLIHASSVIHQPTIYLVLFANLLIWVALLIILAGLRRYERGDLLSSFTVLIWLFGALSFGIIVGHNPRFGGSIYPLLVLFLIRTASLATAFPSKVAASLATAVLAIVFIFNLLVVFPRQVSVYKSEQVSMEKLIEALKIYSKDAGTIFVANSADSFSSPEYVAAFAKIPSRLVILNEFSGCLDNGQAHTTLSRLTDDDLSISLSIPKCASFSFEGISPNKFSPSANSAARGDFGRYFFGDAASVVANPDSHSGSNRLFGDRLRIELREANPEDSIVLYYDWQSASYKCYGRACTT